MAKYSGPEPLSYIDKKIVTWHRDFYLGHILFDKDDIRGVIYSNISECSWDIWQGKRCWWTNIWRRMWETSLLYPSILFMDMVKNVFYPQY